MDDSNRIYKILEKMDSRLDNVDITLAKQQVSLDEHIRRTELLETKVEPIQKHVNMVDGALKFIGGIVTGKQA